MGEGDLKTRRRRKLRQGEAPRFLTQMDFPAPAGCVYPTWAHRAVGFGSQDLHVRLIARDEANGIIRAHHCSNLLRKDKAYYSQFNWHVWRQFRYVFFIDRRLMRVIKLKRQPYPKR